ncbi:GNAT family acetyltransferase [Bacillus sp. LL01]|uniref:GNAT family N-acetyltransferase n=1 Tax=Bacillus sp. LL01 TaxID=1665556 RepID=UPI00064D24A0|nr:GNAT family N-acetyltransferase [Bacillus sp. LL01]KMJ57243.1 GNAT family acetyltransferase [Bacillus sp. LL01]
MINVEIRRPMEDDINNLNQFFRAVITDTFNKEGIVDKIEDMENEIEGKKTYLARDLESNGEKRFFLLALDGDKIIGTIEYGAASELICMCTNNAFKGLHEVGTIFVHPDYQRKGIGNLLLNRIMLAMQSKCITEFCLDSGYVSAQRIWTKKFGDPAFLLEDFWDEGYHHMIWRVKCERKGI